MSLGAATYSRQAARVSSRLVHYCTSALNRISDIFWEVRLGVRTKGNTFSRHPDAHDYGYLAYHTYFSIFDALVLTPSDIVVDLGCGKGRIVCAAAMYDVTEVVGVEIDTHLADLAKANVARLRRRRAPVRIVADSAVNFDFDPATVIVMFHPFGIDTMREVLDRLEQSLTRRPRMLRIVYANPEYGAVLAEKPWLDLYECRRPKLWSRLKFRVHFYRATI